MRPSSSTPSLLPFLVAGVLVLLALNLVHLAWEWWGSSTVNLPVRQARGAVADSAPRQLEVPLFGHNLQFGQAGAAATLVIFTDPACTPCRAQVASAISLLPQGGKGVRVAYKFWPQAESNPGGGLVSEIARREGKTVPFMRALEAQPAAQGDDLLAVLEAAGVPLATQQDWLKNKIGELIATLNQDITQGQNLNLGPAPQFVLNGYLLEPATLPVARLGTYVQRLNAGEGIIRPDDYWLNP